MRRANVPSIHAYAPTPRVGVVLLCALAFLSCDSDSTVPEQDADAPARRPNILLLLADDLVELHAILIDSDEPAALEFLKTRVAPKIPEKGTAPCDSTRCNPYLLKPGSD